MRWACLFFALIGCAPSAPSSGATVPFRLDALNSPAPELPDACTDVEARRSRWVVFVQDDCVQCETWLRALTAEREVLAAADTSIEVVVLGRGGCAEAMRVAGGYPFARRAGDDRVEDAWVVTSTPVTYRVEGGMIRGRLEGRRPLSALRAAGWLR